MRTRFRGSILFITLVFILLFFTSLGWVQAASRPAAPLSPGAQQGTAFTYQGELSKNGSPVNGSCDFQFSLYDAASGGSQVGSAVTKNGVAVSAGRFTVELDFGAGVFTGDARYLQVAVKCAGESGFTTLSGRIALNPTPYALSLRPGATIVGAQDGTAVLTGQNTSTVDGSSGLYGYADADNVTNYGVYGKSRSRYGSGVYGTAPFTGVTGVGSVFQGIGVYGEAGMLGQGVYGAAQEGTGVYGKSGVGTGVYGEGTSGAGFGVYGTAPVTGTVGVASATSGSTVGVYGESRSSTGTGVVGRAPATGVYGEATEDGALLEPSYGVYGKAGPATFIGNSYGVYSEGPAHVEGPLTWKAVTSYVSLPAAAFHPTDNNAAFVNSGYKIVPGNAASENYLASVQLPHGATVTKLTFYWTDSSNADGSAALYRIDLAGSEDLMAKAFSSGGSSSSNGGSTVTGSSEDTSIDNAQVDNSQYAYYVWLTLPTDVYGSTVDAHGVVIEYTITQPY